MSDTTFAPDRKTGANATARKDGIGAYSGVGPEPLARLSDIDEFRAGYAETVKYGLIDDEAFFFWLEANHREVFAGGPARAEAIAHACAAKARVVAADEHEAGARALLNLGHTFGHALESATGYSSRLIHGEGVAIGTVLAYKFSASLGLAPSQDGVRIVRHLDSVGLPTQISDIPGPTPGVDELMQAIAQDKKVERGALTFILTRGIGRSFIEKNVDPETVAAFLQEQISA